MHRRMTESDKKSCDRSIGVLICDDVESMRVLLGVVIGLQPGLHVAGEAEDDEQAIAEAQRLQPDVVLLDLSMPQRTGLGGREL